MAEGILRDGRRALVCLFVGRAFRLSHILAALAFTLQTSSQILLHYCILAFPSSCQQPCLSPCVRHESFQRSRPGSLSYTNRPRRSFSPRSYHACMDYLYCPLEELRNEITRRGFIAYGGRDELSEGLCNDDVVRGADATTICTTAIRGCAQPRSKCHGVNPTLLIGER